MQDRCAMKTLRFILLLLLVSFLSAGRDAFNITVQTHYIAVEFLNMDLEAYTEWLPDTLDFDETVYMLSDEIIIINNRSNVDIVLSASTSDEPDDGYSSSYHHWEAVEDFADIDKYILRAWLFDTPVHDTLATDFSVLLEYPAEIVPLFPIGGTYYCFMALTTPTATTDWFAHNLIVRFEVSAF